MGANRQLQISRKIQNGHEADGQSITWDGTRSAPTWLQAKGRRAHATPAGSVDILTDREQSYGHC